MPTSPTRHTPFCLALLVLASCAGPSQPSALASEPTSAERNVADEQPAQETVTEPREPAAPPTHEALMAVLGAVTTPIADLSECVDPGNRPENTLGQTIRQTLSETDIHTTECETREGGFTCHTSLVSSEGEWALILRYDTDASGTINVTTVVCDLAG